MKTRFHRQLIGISVAAACAVACAPGAISASNPFARFEYNAQKQTGAIDLSFSVDWNVSAPPTIMPTATGAPVPLDQAYLQALIRETARTVFAMSNGAHTLRNVYIYDNSQFMNTADIRIHNRDGRSNANISGWLRPGTRNEIFPTMGNQVETPEQTGQVIAHELGHYFYGVFDEYVEAGRPLSADNPGSPAATDTAKNTVMHDQYQWWNFSSSADYADPAAQATAQFRVYKASAWDTLVRNPTLDPLLDGYSPRHSFEPFKTWGAAPGVSNEAARQTHDLPAAVESVSMTLNPPVRSLVLIDLLAPAGEVEGQKNAVARMIDNLGASTTFGVAATNPAGTLQWVVAPAKLAAGAERDAAKQAVNALAEASGSSVDISGALKELLAAATTDAAAQGNFVTLFASNRIVVGNPAQLVAETGVATKTVAFTQITLGNQSHAESLSEFLVASTRPAQRYSVNSGSEIGRVAGRATQNEKAKSESTVVEDEIETLLKKGETVTRDIVLSAYDTTASFLVFGGDDDIGHLAATTTSAI
ncbi:MAG: hypothetical protein HY777_02915 [Betaproteobacteria bacterium]|nr:hypothetical protein [Betaproteobacteria bacterium]